MIQPLKYLLYDVTAEILLGFCVPRVTAENRVILLKAHLIRVCLSIFGCVVMAMPSLFADQSNYFTLAAFFRHN